MQFHPTSTDASKRSERALALATTPGQDALRAVLRSGGILRRLFEPHLSRFGLTLAQWGVLRTLARHEAMGLPPMCMGEVGASTFVQPPSMSATLARMENLGLISRTTDEADSRSRRVHLTQFGRDAIATVLPEHREWMARVTSVLSDQECVQLHGLLMRMADHMCELDAHPGSAFRSCEVRPEVRVVSRPANAPGS